MIACACGMNEWLVEYECVCRQMDEWMVSGWNECECVARAPCNTGWKLNCSQLLWSIYIYTMIRVCKRDQRERWQRYKRKDRNKECLLEGCIQLQFDWHEWIKRTQTSNQERTSQQHYIHFDSGYSKGRDKEPPKPTWGMYMRRSCITAWSQARAKRAWARTTLPPLAMYSGVQVSYVLIRFCFTPGGACETRHVSMWKHQGNAAKETLLQTMSVMCSVNLLSISNQPQPFITPIMHKKKYKIMYSTSDAYMHVWCESNTDNKSLLLLHLTIQKQTTKNRSSDLAQREGEGGRDLLSTIVDLI